MGSKGKGGERGEGMVEEGRGGEGKSTSERAPSSKLPLHHWCGVVMGHSGSMEIALFDRVHTSPISVPY